MEAELWSTEVSAQRCWFCWNIRSNRIFDPRNICSLFIRWVIKKHQRSDQSEEFQLQRGDCFSERWQKVAVNDFIDYSTSCPEPNPPPLIPARCGISLASTPPFFIFHHRNHTSEHVIYNLDLCFLVPLSFYSSSPPSFLLPADRLLRFNARRHHDSGLILFSFSF